MNQKKVGQFLKKLRKERNLTQEALAETLNVSGRTVSRWETGTNMPDISLLVELSEFYQVSIPEIIDGERKRENMDQETKNTAIKMAEYSKNELSTEKRKTISVLLIIFALFVMITALAIFPNESSWGSFYSVIGGVALTVGIFFRVKDVLLKRSSRIFTVICCAVVLFGIFTVSDYIAVTQFQQVPRFSYVKSYGEDVVEHKTLFYTVIQKNPGTADETVQIKK